MPRLFLLDGHALAFRAFYAIDAALSTKDGRPTNAVYGFALMLQKLMDQHKPDYIVASFDRGKPTVRLERYPEYKAQRDKIPDELRLQIDFIKEMLLAYGVSIFEVDGHEADDVIGTLTRLAENAGIDSVIVTSDRDSLQLISPRIKVLLTKRGVTDTELVGEKEVLDKYGLNPRQLIDLKAFMGDASDNIKGVKGVGEKTALALVQEFKSVEGVYDNLSSISKARLLELLSAGRDDAFLSKFLATIVRDIPLDVDFACYTPLQPDIPRLSRFYRDLELNSLAAKIEPQKKVEFSDSNRAISGTESMVKNTEDPAVFFQSLTSCASPVAFLKPTPTKYILATKENVIVIEAKEGLLPEEVVGFFADARCKWVVSGYKELLLEFLKRGINFGPDVFDVELAAYLLDPTKAGYPIRELAESYLGKTVEEGPAEALALLKLQQVLAEQLVEKNLWQLYQEVELPLSRVLADMEVLGVAVDKDVLKTMAAETEARLQIIVREIHALAGEEFNISSPKQLGFILFEKLGLPVQKKTKTGYSTDAEVLEILADQHPLVSKILDFRTLAKLQSTYLEGLQKVITPSGKIHTTYNQTVAVTGRLSSTEPNLQNIPMRLPEGRLIRRAFTPGPGFTRILTADYSQVELRILAHLSQDAILLEAFRQGEDIHRRTAAEVFGVSLEEVTPGMRARAKAVNFGIVYGISDYGLAKDIKVTRTEAREYIDNYFRRYHGVKEYIERTILEARSTGFVTTLLNRRRFLPDINSKNFTLRSFAERTAMNTPIQGTAADLIKIAMVAIQHSLKQNALLSHMILSVHDELVFETTEEELSILQPLVREAMETALTLSVHLAVDFKVGVNWYDLSPLKSGTSGGQHA